MRHGGLFFNTMEKQPTNLRYYFITSVLTTLLVLYISKNTYRESLKKVLVTLAEKEWNSRDSVLFFAIAPVKFPSIDFG